MNEWECVSITNPRPLTVPRLSSLWLRWVGGFRRSWRTVTVSLGNNTPESAARFSAVTFPVCFRTIPLLAAWGADWRGAAGGWSSEERMVLLNTRRHQDLQKCCQNRKMLWTLTKLSSSPTLFFFFLSVKDLACLTGFSKFPELLRSQSIWHYCHLGNSKPLKNAFCVLDLWKPFEPWWVLRHIVFWFSQ